MEFEDDYEALPESAPWWTHPVAGAFAGLGEHTVMYPVDVVKTRMQALVPNSSHGQYRSLYGGIKKLLKLDGVRGSWRGVAAISIGAAPSHALYFSAYEFCKEHCNAGPIKDTVLVNALAGCVSTVAHDSIMIPAEVVKQRMQVCDSKFKRCRDCGRCILMEEGLFAFYRSFTTQCAMNIPFHVTNFVVYDYSQRYVFNRDKKYSPLAHSLSGAIAGAAAATITNPLDVCKTLLNTQEQFALAKGNGNRPVNGLFGACRIIYDIKGWRGFYQGLTARVCFQMPATCISWTVYEFFKHFIISRS